MSGNPVRVAVVGDRLSKFAAQDSIEVALGHSADRVGVQVEVEWFATPKLEAHAAQQLRSADAIWCAPGSPYLSIDGALEGIRVARETGRPFLGTCAGFQHGVLEVARNLLGIADAQHAEYEPENAAAPLFIDELLCSLVGQAMHVRLVDEVARGYFGADEVLEQYYCRFGLNESHRDALAAEGLLVAGVDIADGTTRIMRLEAHPFYFLTLFVPQTSSTPAAPHPLITAYLDAATRSRTPAP
jgi:CTP synthase (UTP-ammonia lyase)